MLVEERYSEYVTKEMKCILWISVDLEAFLGSNRNVPLTISLLSLLFLAGSGCLCGRLYYTHRPTGAEYVVKQIDRSTMYWGDLDALKD
jgi:hypothetical protein